MINVGPAPLRALVVFASSVLSLPTSGSIVSLGLKRDRMNSTIDVLQSTDTVTVGEDETKIRRTGTMHPVFIRQFPCFLGG